MNDNCKPYELKPQNGNTNPALLIQESQERQLNDYLDHSNDYIDLNNAPLI